MVARLKPIDNRGRRKSGPNKSHTPEPIQTLFEVLPGPAFRARFDVAPASKVMSMVQMPKAIISLQDRCGNRVIDDSVQVHARLSNASTMNPTLFHNGKKCKNNSIPVTLHEGQGTITGLSVDTIGRYKLEALLLSAEGGNPSTKWTAQKSTFVVLPGEPALQWAWRRHIDDDVPEKKFLIAAGESLVAMVPERLHSSCQPMLRVRDAGGNVNKVDGAADVWLMEERQGKAKRSLITYGGKFKKTSAKFLKVRCLKGCINLADKEISIKQQGRYHFVARMSLGDKVFEVCSESFDVTPSPTTAVLRLQKAVRHKFLFRRSLLTLLEQMRGLNVDLALASQLCTTSCERAINAAETAVAWQVAERSRQRAASAGDRAVRYASARLAYVQWENDLSRKSESSRNKAWTAAAHAVAHAKLSVACLEADVAGEQAANAARASVVAAAAAVTTARKQNVFKDYCRDLILAAGASAQTAVHSAILCETWLQAQESKKDAESAALMAISQALDCVKTAIWRTKMIDNAGNSRASAATAAQSAIAHAQRTAAWHIADAAKRKSEAAARAGMAAANESCEQVRKNAATRLQCSIRWRKANASVAKLKSTVRGIIFSTEPSSENIAGQLFFTQPQVVALNCHPSSYTGYLAPLHIGGRTLDLSGYAKRHIAPCSDEVQLQLEAIDESEEDDITGEVQQQVAGFAHEERALQSLTNGVSNFSGLCVEKSGKYRLSACLDTRSVLAQLRGEPGQMLGQSNSFDVVPSLPHHLHFFVPPGPEDKVFCNSVLLQQPVVHVRDRYGNLCQACNNGQIQVSVRGTKQSSSPAVASQSSLGLSCAIQRGVADFCFHQLVLSVVGSYHLVANAHNISVVGPRHGQDQPEDESETLAVEEVRHKLEVKNLSDHIQSVVSNLHSEKEQVEKTLKQQIRRLRMSMKQKAQKTESQLQAELDNQKLKAEVIVEEKEREKAEAVARTKAKVEKEAKAITSKLKHKLKKRQQELREAEAIHLAELGNKQHEIDHLQAEVQRLRQGWDTEAVHRRRDRQSMLNQLQHSPFTSSRFQRIARSNRNRGTPPSATARRPSGETPTNTAITGASGASTQRRSISRRRRSTIGEDGRPVRLELSPDDDADADTAESKTAEAKEATKEGQGTAGGEPAAWRKATGSATVAGSGDNSTAMFYRRQPTSKLDM